MRNEFAWLPALVRCLLVAFAGCLLVAPGSGPALAPGRPVDDWPYYGHDPGGMRYSPLAEINRENVSRLKVAWVFHTGDISDGSHQRRRSGFETTPILVDGTLYLTTPFNRVIALDPETGAQHWSYDPKVDLTLPYGDGLINRGAAAWLDAARSAGQTCRRRIFEATLDGRLIALDSATGAPCADFGQGGQVSLRDIPRYIPGRYHMTSPPAVIDDLVVVGSAIDDNARVDMPGGVVRAFDARSGALRWSWDPIPPNPSGAANRAVAPVSPPATRSTTAGAGNSAWRSGAANAWSVMAVDPDRGLVFVPTGSASPDYYGGLRLGDDKWADSVVALRAGTGEVAWGFQLVHHDLWDYDTASPPLLATLRRGGEDVPVVVQGNKTGLLYVLNRETGAPIFPVEERPVPQSDVPGEVTSPTQPFPVAPPPLAPQRVAADNAWGLTSTDRETCRKRLGSFRNSGLFTPPALGDTLAIPGNLGGMNWSGYAFDPQRQLLLVNTNNLPFVVKLIPHDQFEAAARSGQGEFASQTGAPYGLSRNVVFSPSGLPCSSPPWGELAAVDMTSGKILWRVPLGSMRDVTTNCALCHGSGGSGNAASPGPIREQAPQLAPMSGSPSLGGPIVTAGGLVFIAGTVDPHLRAFDVETGKELWNAELPASGHATPMTYRLSATGKQYVVIAAGGHAKVREEKQGDALVAFALP
ncbi:MAG: pyrroloquinoline quinone-dependent dehydrogenase [Acidobacteria bacterium]|nr:MAG: pyrroloquinoline quinone-dependent dehydrogenase [Acidobacteriota bacterium]